ncbi:MAG: glutamine--fructose-6-phosphate transaminase (isomerizing) [Candidatus Berkelbacteria bacterium]|nr:glutamine--fructose-6-phosphate transaminase (isomerizing) [Candidatus Berkelbacteria bacterium]
MCGIVGYFGSKDGMGAVVEGLKRLEYRGYDSWGLAARTDRKILIHKEIGKIGSFNLKKDLPNFGGKICIGHTRWATHGGVTAINSHPHLSCDGRIAVVHNGIVENYQELRAALEKKGHKFKSQTDTEVIAHLIEQELRTKKNIVEAVRSALKKIEGSFALGIIDRENDILIGARYASPLVLGIAKDEFYLGSDVPAFLKYANQVVFLDEREMVVLSHGKSGNAQFDLMNIDSGKKIKAKITKIKWSAEEAEKGGHPHFMIKEMLEQPLVIRKTAATEKEELEKAAALIKKAKRVFVVACGTALHAGIYGSYLLAKRNNIMVQPISAGELSYFSHLFKKGDLVITVSQSGETADVLEAVRSAHKAGAKVLALVNVLGSSLMRAADRSILTKAGSEICVLSTKAYISQQAMFAMLSGALNGETAKMKKSLLEVADAIEKIIEKKNLGKIKTLAKKLSKVPNLYGLGRSLNYANSLESCLKIKEVSYIHAEGFAGGDLKHGPIALIEKDVPVMVFATPDSTEKEIVSNAMEVKARGAFVIGISFQNNSVYEEFLPVTDLGDLTPIAAIVYTQLLAYYLALEKKLDPAKPTHLANGVTVN